jgi:hypothetical protein
MKKPKQKANVKKKWAIVDVFHGNGEEASIWFQKVLTKHQKHEPKTRLVALVAKSK